MKICILACLIVVAWAVDHGHHGHHGDSGHHVEHGCAHDSSYCANNHHCPVGEHGVCDGHTCVCRPDGNGHAVGRAVDHGHHGHHGDSGHDGHHGHVDHGCEHDASACAHHSCPDGQHGHCVSNQCQCQDDAHAVGRDVHGHHGDSGHHQDSGHHGHTGCSHDSHLCGQMNCPSGQHGVCLSDVCMCQDTSVVGRDVHGHHGDTGGHHGDSGHHGHPHPGGITNCDHDASKCATGCLAGQTGYCYLDTCYCRVHPIVRQAHPTCQSDADCSTMHCGHIHGPGHTHGGYCTPNHHCSCHHASACTTDTDCLGFCHGAHANGTSTCHTIHGHGHCTHCH